MTQTRDERRATVRAEQEKVAPGSGFVAWVDRTTWSFGGAERAGAWSWTNAGIAFVTFAVVAIVIGADAGAAAGGFIALTLALARGYSVHRRYLRRRAGG